MGAELAIDVDVTISEELRDLMRQRRSGFQPVEAPDPAPHISLVHGKDGRGLPGQASMEPPLPLPEWQTHVLRQDGARPLKFLGLKLFESHARVADLPGTAELNLSLFLSEGEVVHIGLSVHPPEGFAARPIHRAATLTDPDAFARLLRDFAPESCLETALVPDAETRAVHASARSALRAAFTSMAAGCLNKAILPA